MHKVKLVIVVTILMCFILSGCTVKTEKASSEQSNIKLLNSQINDLNQQLQALKDENKNQLTKLDRLKSDNQSLLMEQQETDEILACLNSNYDNMPVPYTQRFIEEDKDITVLPDSRLKPLRSIGKGTVLEILAAADIIVPGSNSLVRWLFVHTDSGDVPAANLGWIKEADTVAYTNENKYLATYPLKIAAGTKDLKNGNLLDDFEIEQNYWLDFYDGKNAQIHGTGGKIHFISKDDLIYPEVKTIESSYK